jgi:hypothetical protein
MDFSAFLWDTSNDVTTEEHDDRHVIIIEQENNVIDPLPSNQKSYTYEHLSLMDTFRLVLGRQFVEQTATTRIGHWYNTLTATQRMAWHELHQAVVEVTDMLHSFLRDRRVLMQPARTATRTSAITAPSQVTSAMPDLLAPPAAARAVRDVRLRPGYARRGRSYRYRMPGHRSGRRHQ